MMTQNKTMFIRCKSTTPATMQAIQNPSLRVIEKAYQMNNELKDLSEESSFSYPHKMDIQMKKYTTKSILNRYKEPQNLWSVFSHKTKTLQCRPEEQEEKPRTHKYHQRENKP